MKTVNFITIQFIEVLIRRVTMTMAKSLFITLTISFTYKTENI